MTYPVITALTASLILIIQTVLATLVIKSRYKHAQGLGDGDHPDLIARIRSHANLTENAPIILVILGLLEMSGSSQTLLAVFGATLVIARLLHPIGLFKTHGTSAPRFIGVMATTIVGIAAAIMLIFVALEKL